MYPRIYRGGAAIQNVGSALNTNRDWDVVQPDVVEDKRSVKGIASPTILDENGSVGNNGIDDRLGTFTPPYASVTHISIVR